MVVAVTLLLGLEHAALLGENARRAEHDLEAVAHVGPLHTRPQM